MSRDSSHPRSRGWHRWWATIRSTRPGPRAWRGAALGALAVFVTILFVSALGLYGPDGPLWVATAFVFLVIAFAAVGGLLTLLGLLVRWLPPLYLWVGASLLGVALFLALVGPSVAIGILATVIATVAAASLLGAGLAVLTGRARLIGPDRPTGARLGRVLAWVGVVVGAGTLLLGGVWLLDAGSPLVMPPLPADARDVAPLDAPDPSQPGSYSVQTLTYGSGQDRHRAVYGDAVAWSTFSVDGADLVGGWSPLRTAYWGFGPEALPRNARVWYPEGEGPFPLVLFLHGQHTMVEDSDPGYAYLGELLAGRGFIVASVDENFLNLSPVLDLLFLSTLEGENDLRGWLLLEHLALWRDWNATPDHLFYGKVDMDAIALVGHSRGGEAVASAAALNRLPVYPDDATIRFDYDFGIRGVVALAPVEGTYQPAGQPIPLTDVNYLVLHGAHDMDVFFYMGTSQYTRAHLSPGSDTFKAGLYIYGANHGQFNTVWGRKDLFEPIMRVFNLEQLLPPAAQQQVARTAISAFLEAALRNESVYRDFFRDPRRGQAWLPETIFLAQYQDAATLTVGTYEEDVDLTTTTLPGGQLAGERLATWREEPLAAKRQTHANQVVLLAWAPPEDGDAASYAVTLSGTDLALTRDAAFVFEIADAGEPPDADAAAADAPAFIDLTLEAEDAAGNVARLPLSDVTYLLPQLEGRVGKAAFFSPFALSEPVLQHVEIPLAAFADANPAFDAASLREVRFVFDRTPGGSVVLDNLGFRPGSP